MTKKKTGDVSAPAQNRYHALIERIFLAHYRKGAKQIPFVRSEIEQAASDLGIDLPKNQGDVIYALRFRTPMPASVIATQPAGYEWIIELAGRAQYKFSLTRKNRIVPNTALARIKTPAATQTPPLMATPNSAT